jgi:hypothetical protein
MKLNTGLNIAHREIGRTCFGSSTGPKDAVRLGQSLAAAVFHPARWLLEESERKKIMSNSTLIVLVVLGVLLFGGGGGYYWRSRR